MCEVVEVGVVGEVPGVVFIRLLSAHSILLFDSNGFAYIVVDRSCLDSCVSAQDQWQLRHSQGS
jgi:hypothetical protein